MSLRKGAEEQPGAGVPRARSQRAPGTSAPFLFTWGVPPFPHEGQPDVGVPRARSQRAPGSITDSIPGLSPLPRRRGGAGSSQL